MIFILSQLKPCWTQSLRSIKKNCLVIYPHLSSFDPSVIAQLFMSINDVTNSVYVGKMTQGPRLNNAQGNNIKGHMVNSVRKI